VTRSVHTFALGVLVTTAAASLLAQAPAQKPAPASNRYVAIGCISREAQPAAGASRGSAAARYLLTDSRGDKPTIYRLEGDASQLDLHVGHTVEVAGPLSPAPAGGRGPNAGALVLKVSSLTWVSTKCSK
jgi:hypothetical protein